ncbi:unnamed protein product, partial [Discosporangium mesarthrocarpum]
GEEDGEEVLAGAGAAASSRAGAGSGGGGGRDGRGSVTGFSHSQSSGVVEALVEQLLTGRMLGERGRGIVEDMPPQAPLGASLPSQPTTQGAEIDRGRASGGSSGGGGSGGDNSSRGRRARGGGKKKDVAKGQARGGRAGGQHGQASWSPMVLPEIGAGGAGVEDGKGRGVLYSSVEEGLGVLNTALRTPAPAVLGAVLELGTALVGQTKRFGAAGSKGPGASSGSPELWQPQWKQLLCSVIANKDLKGSKHAAKRLLRKICRNQSSYHLVRDSYQFTVELNHVIDALTPSMAATALALLSNHAQEGEEERAG